MQFAIKLLINAVLVALFVYMSYVSVKYTAASRKTMQISRIPYSVLDFSAVLGFASMSIYSVLFLLQGLFRPEEFKARFLAGQGVQRETEDTP